MPPHRKMNFAISGKYTNRMLPKLTGNIDFNKLLTKIQFLFCPVRIIIGVGIRNLGAP